MRIGQITLQNFRNYENLELNLPSGTSLFLGNNGTGKTGILEAVGILANLESIRGANSQVLVKKNTARALLRGQFTAASGQRKQMQIEIPAGSRLSAKLQNKKAPSKQILKSAIPVTSFLPGDLDLISGPPAGRRTALDNAVLATGSESVHQLFAALTNVLKQRNALLRSQPPSELSVAQLEMLDIYDSELVRTGEAWAAERQKLVPSLQEQMRRRYLEIAEQPILLEMKYEPNWMNEGLAAALRTARPQDFARRLTSTGPHKDDWEIYLDDMPARFTASRGEQRMLALAFVLGVHIFIAEAAEVPILLLDDVFSELDIKRSLKFFELLPAGQILITSAVALSPEYQIQDTYKISLDSRGSAEILNYSLS